MLYVISFLAPYTRLSSKQNADAISKGYQFMQQLTLSLKASLASEAKARERKCGEVLCYLLQLSPSALPQRSRSTEPFAARKGRFGTAAGDNNCLHPLQLSPRTCPQTFRGSKLLCGTKQVLTSSVRAARGIICKSMNRNTNQVSCPRDTLELPPAGDALLPWRCALTHSCFSHVSEVNKV